MRTPSTRTLVLIGVLIGLVAGMALAATFAPGDAVKNTDGVPYGAPDGMNVTLHGEANVSAEDVFPNSSTHSSQFADRAVILNTSEGNITLASDNPAWASVHTTNLTGPWTNVTDIQAGGTWIETYPENKQRVDVRGDTDSISISNMSVDDSSPDFVIDGSDGGTGSVRLYSLPANTQIRAVDANGNYLDHATSDGSGTLDLNIGLSEHTVYLQTFGSTNTPTLSNADPQGIVSDTPDELAVEIADSDMPSDEVDVTIDLDGSQIHSETVTGNSTVSTTNFGTLGLGPHSWTVEATDAYGNTQTETYNFRLPSNITLRNETDADQRILGENITATFYSANGDIVLERSDMNGDGNISLRGLPDTEFVVTFEGSGWYDRRAYIESIGNQQNIYLLNSTAYPTVDDSAIETTFVYEDRTNEFDQDETTLRIERAVDPNDDGNFSWQTIAGDYWGAAGEFPFVGEYQARYRLVIKNQETGERRELGTHIPSGDGVKNIVIGDIIFDAENATGRYYDAGINGNTSNLQAYYNDPTNSTTDLSITVYRQGNRSNTIYNTTVAGPIGEHVAQIPLNDSQAEQNWIVEFEGDHSSGTVFGQIIVGGAGFPLPMDPAMLSAFGLTMITFVMALYGPRTAIMGAWAGVIALAGLMFVGLLSWSIPALMLALMAATGGTLYSEAMP